MNRSRNNTHIFILNYLFMIIDQLGNTHKNTGLFETIQAHNL